jgi:hypothetical protein
MPLRLSFSDSGLVGRFSRVPTDPRRTIAGTRSENTRVERESIRARPVRLSAELRTGRKLDVVFCALIIYVGCQRRTECAIPARIIQPVVNRPIELAPEIPLTLLNGYYVRLCDCKGAGLRIELNRLGCCLVVSDFCNLPYVPLTVLELNKRTSLCFPICPLGSNRDFALAALQ